MRKKKRYSWAERRAYYIGVGYSMAFSGKVHTARLLSDSFGRNMSKKESDSYQQGLLAPDKRPDMFKKKR